MWGEKKALKEMLAYNIDDVILLEKVYLKLLPFITAHPNLGVIQGTMDTCPNCGAIGTLVRNGTRLVGRVSRRQRYQCTSCGSFPSGGIIPVKDEEGNRLVIR